MFTNNNGEAIISNDIMDSPLLFVNINGISVGHYVIWHNGLPIIIRKH